MNGWMNGQIFYLQLPYFVKLLILDADNLLSQTSFESKEREFLCRQSMKLYLSLKTFVTFIDDNLKM